MECSRTVPAKARTAGDRARTAGDRARTAGDRARTAGDKARTAGEPLAPEMNLPAAERTGYLVSVALITRFVLQGNYLLWGLLPFFVGVTSLNRRRAAGY
ncbi:MAG: hypothetical protein LBQ14_12900 [Treponema sp.]|nr:hypothetical protein [Treponema sp.]